MKSATLVPLVLLAVAALQAQQPPVRFKVDVSLVEVDVIVTDRQGEPVRGLTQDDFQVFQDGRPQGIAAFSIVDIPIARTERIPLLSQIEPDVVSNFQEVDGRVFLLLLDDLQTDHSNTLHVRRAARKFVEDHVSDNDLVAITQTGPAGRHLQDLTQSKSRLLRVIDEFTGAKIPSATRMRVEDFKNQVYLPDEFKKPPQDTADDYRAHRARMMLDRLSQLSEWVGRIGGRRKAIVYFGEGIDYDLKESVAVSDAGIRRDVRAIHTAIRDFIATATRSGVSVYTIDPRGLSTGMDEGISISGQWDPRNVSGAGVTTLMDEMHRSHASMRTIAEATGGLAFFNRNEFAAAFDRIVEDNSTYYLIGYYEKEKPRRGQLPRLEVKVARPGLVARTRRGYLAPPRIETAIAPGKMSPALRDALRSPVPVHGLGLSVYAAPFRGHTREASVALVIEIAAPRMRFVERDGRFETNVELALTPIDVQKQQAKFTLVDNVALRLLPETHAVVAQHGVRLTRRLLLPPGRYRVAVGAHESNGGAVGTVFADVDVPDFPAAALQMSGIALASEASTSQIQTANEEPGVTDVLPGSATALREFAATDALSLYTEIYDNEPRTHHRIVVRTTVTAADGREVFTALDQRRTQEAANFGLTHLLKIPLARFPPGRYVLNVEARQLLEKEKMGSVATRAVEFRVR